MCTKKIASMLFFILNLLLSSAYADNAAILNVAVTTNALAQIKGFYTATYTHTNFDLQAGMDDRDPYIFSMFKVDKHALDQFTPVNNRLLPARFDFIYPTLGVHFKTSANSKLSGISWIICLDDNALRLTLDPKKLLPGNDRTDITYKDVYAISLPPFLTAYVAHCDCTGPACFWVKDDNSKQRMQFSSNYMG